MLSSHNFLKEMNITLVAAQGNEFIWQMYKSQID